eukprot:TRINITY_DN5111_c0_g1_i1.p1 TRINITY_DN5111_c0_g1~~TRINITY_DN5111_c0_g1_i1.p1  ORF type:complete len:683 (-),score=98.29 TRINITY_DN5111_c0_g1_i1:107-1861(-)
MLARLGSENRSLVRVAVIVSLLGFFLNTAFNCGSFSAIVGECGRSEVGRLVREARNMIHRGIAATVTLAIVGYSWSWGSRWKSPVSEFVATNSFFTKEQIDSNSSACMKHVLKSVWPFVSEFVESTFRNEIEPAVKEALPSSLQGLRFTAINMGLLPPDLESLRAINVKKHIVGGEPESLVLCLDVVYKGDANLGLSVLGIPVGVSDIKVGGKLAIEIPQMLPKPPFIGGLRIFFPNPVTIEANWKCVANIAGWELVQTKVHGVIDSHICSRLVLPNCVPARFDESIDTFRFNRAPPRGLLRLTVVEARCLKVSDLSITSFGEMVSTDHFVQVRFGAAEGWRTRTVPKSVNPVWQDQVQDFLVDMPEIQDFRFLVYDEGFGSLHDFVGESVVSAQHLIANGDVWVDIADGKDAGEKNGCKKLGSKLRLAAEWRSLLMDTSALGSESPTGDGDDPVCHLYVGIYSAVGVPKGIAFSCHAEVEGQRQCTQKKFAEWIEGAINSEDPQLSVEWKEPLMFLLRDPHTATVQLTARATSDKTCFEASYSVARLLSLEGSTEVVNLELTGGGHLHARMELRAFGPVTRSV